MPSRNGVAIKQKVKHKRILKSMTRIKTRRPHGKRTNLHYLSLGSCMDVGEFEKDAWEFHFPYHI